MNMFLDVVGDFPGILVPALIIGIPVLCVVLAEHSRTRRRSNR